MVLAGVTRNELVGLSSATCDIDFTCVANTAGGDLIYRMRAQNGIAQEVVGLDGHLDAELNRLESMIGTGIQPPVTGYSAT
jgi:hypothetical protein